MSETKVDRSSGTGVSRRGFLGGVGGAAAMAAIGSMGVAAGSENAQAPARGATVIENPLLRQSAAFNLRVGAAKYNLTQTLFPQSTNTDETLYPSLIGTYTKGLPHNRFGEVDPQAWATLKEALSAGSPAAFERVVLGGKLPLSNPQAGLAFDLEGADGHFFSSGPAPALASAETAGEMVELYWMALLRDTALDDYSRSPLTEDAVADLNKLSNFKGLRDSTGKVTPKTLFRDPLPGCATGPYVSQLVLLNTPFGSQFVDRRIRTFLPGSDHLTGYDEWLTVQNGSVPGRSSFDPIRRYVRNGRDLGAWVHTDAILPACLNACMILLTPPDASDPESSGLGAPVNPGNPYRKSRSQSGLATFGSPGTLGLLTEVATRALKASFYQKWFVHRRLRPEAYGGLIHTQRTRNRWPRVLHADVLNSPVLDRVFSKNGTYLHPAAFPEGSPVNPSYTGGHGAVAGACITILKALFDENFVLPTPIQVTADGLDFEPYTGPDLSLGGELNKLASNIATARNFAGVHWRSDSIQSLRLGEAMAISILRDQRVLYNENREGFFGGLTFTKFDGTRVTV